ncbi:MAG: spore germination protein [Clostridia bacterium]|nr:spore germination protein [Clostridia bacterium]
MKNFLKFVPNKEPKTFEIEKPTVSPTISKEINIHQNLSENIEMLSQLLHYPKTNDVQFRFFDTSINHQNYHAMIVYYDGLSDSQIISDFLIEQFMNHDDNPENLSLDNMQKQKQSSVIVSNNKSSGKTNTNLKDIISGRIIAQSSVSFATTYQEIVDSILHGDCALLVDSLDTAFLCDVKKLPGRSITKAENEMNLRGPSEAFIENFRANTALIRKFVKDENLIFETIEVGNKSKTRCAISYISSITNDSIVEEVKRRIESLEIDYLIDSGQLEQLIEDRTFLIDPVILNTERPDKVASHLVEGRVAILVEGSNNVLIVPAVYSDFTQSSEDSYVRFPYSVLLRIFRLPATFFSIFLPGLYIAICDFHQEMIPSDLLFTIAGTREKVPFTMLMELLIMEIAFEIIREASIRTPAPVGPTLGIVGTLILGQAIVSANIVSPVLVIIVALTGISSFAVANYSLNYSFRILRFVYIFLGASMGFFRYLLRVIYPNHVTLFNIVLWSTLFNTIYAISKGSI